ncbi:lipase family protein [Kineosporia sp. R_H_3]|uniref:lipase family protein n=1 Tax=Kineosporia sp. R_H_3 TaxID=1961848 RepID=UPI000B4BD9BC|nr:lipase family protein [Kineosporia sp. R_H_3]
MDDAGRQAGRGRLGRTWARRAGTRRTAAGLAVAALAAGGTTAVASPAAAATAATTCSATAAQVYAPPSGPLTLAPGTVLACRKVPDGTTSWRSVTSYQVRYVTTDRTGARIPTTGILMVPRTVWGPGALPVVAYSSTTVGLGTQCAASRQFTGGLLGGYVDDIEITAVSDLLNDGAIVALSDGVGYLEGRTHTYVTGVNNGHAQLDMARAASRVPGAGVAKAPRVALAGYSEGGHSTLWAAQLARGYAPELDIRGAAAGAAPVDLKATATNLNGGLYAGFLADSVVGLSTAYPSMPFRSLLNPAGVEATDDVRTQCLVGTLATWAFRRIETYSTDHLTLEQIYAIKGPDGTWGQVIDAQKVGVGVGRPGSGAKYEIGFPVLDYWGSIDDVIPPASQAAGAKRLCAAGIAVRRKEYALGVHATTIVAASSDVRSWLGARLNGLPDAGNC